MNPWAYSLNLTNFLRDTTVYFLVLDPKCVRKEDFARNIQRTSTLIPNRRGGEANQSLALQDCCRFWRRGGPLFEPFWPFQNQPNHSLGGRTLPMQLQRHNAHIKAEETLKLRLSNNLFIRRCVTTTYRGLQTVSIRQSRTVKSTSYNSLCLLTVRTQHLTQKLIRHAAFYELVLWQNAVAVEVHLRENFRGSFVGIVGGIAVGHWTANHVVNCL